VVLAWLRPAWTKLIVSAAGLAGSTLRKARPVLSSVPGAGGALLLCYGLGQIYSPLRWIAAGALLLLLDARMP
jgi:hypothetical protein